MVITEIARARAMVGRATCSGLTAFVVEAVAVRIPTGGSGARGDPGRAAAFQDILATARRIAACYCRLTRIVKTVVVAIIAGAQRISPLLRTTDPRQRLAHPASEMARDWGTGPDERRGLAYPVTTPESVPDRHGRLARDATHATRARS